MPYRSVQKGLVLVGTLSALSMLLTLPALVGAQPGGSPPSGNVNATFNSVTINDGSADNLQVASDGVISSATGGVQVNDPQGLFVNGTSGIGPVLTVTGNGAHNAKMHSDGWITGSGGFHLGGDGTFGNSKFVIYADGKLTDNDGPVQIWDGDGLDVRGDITNAGGQLQLNDDVEGIRLDSDTVVNNDLTVYNSIQAFNNVQASTGNITWHLKAREIGNYGLSKNYYKTMPPNAATDFDFDLSSGRLTCPDESVAVACNFQVYNGTDGCGLGSPTGGLNKNAAYPTYEFMDPIWNSNYGGVCSKTLFNKTGSWMCGKVQVVCWDPDGN